MHVHCACLCVHFIISVVIVWGKWIYIHTHLELSMRVIIDFKNLKKIKKIMRKCKLKIDIIQQGDSLIMITKEIMYMQVTVIQTPTNIICIYFRFVFV